MSQQVRVAAAQAEPRWLDLAAGLEQVVELIAEAARGGGQLVAFPETFLPGYPWWIWLDAPAGGLRFLARYRENSRTREGAERDQIAAAAAEQGIHVALGFSERVACQRDGGSLSMAQAFIDECGRLLSVRRTLMPTPVERSVVGQGDGSDFQVHDTRWGRGGGLSCGEHFQPLIKYTMDSLGEQIPGAAWPSSSLYRGAATALSPQVNNAASLVDALEGQTFVLAPCAVVGTGAHELFCDTDIKKQLLLHGGGFARISGPEGREGAEPLGKTEEGLLLADLDFSLLAIAKSTADPLGHSWRPEVFWLQVTLAPTPTIVHRGAGPRSTAPECDDVVFVSVASGAR